MRRTEQSESMESARARGRSPFCAVAAVGGVFGVELPGGLTGDCNKWAGSAIAATAIYAAPIPNLWGNPVRGDYYEARAWSWCDPHKTSLRE